jgi:hypothetical protein
MSLTELVSDPAWLFDFGLSIRHWPHEVAMDSPSTWELGDSYRLAALQAISADSDGAVHRMAWSKNAILVQVDFPLSHCVAPVETTIWLDFYIDTRSSRGIHRANGFCHLYQFRLRQAVTAPFDDKAMPVRPGLISRAKNIPTYPMGFPCRGWVSASATRTKIKAAIPYDALVGCDPLEFPEWRVTWEAGDPKRHRLVRRPQSVPLDDPSLWCCARLVDTEDA